MICNHCGVMATWSRKIMKNSWESFAFFVKRPLMVKFSYFVPNVFILTLIDVLFLNFVKFGQRGNWWTRALLTWQKQNKISPGSPAVTTVQITQRNYHGQPPTMYSDCSRFHPIRFTFSRVIAEQVNTVKTCRKVNPISGWSPASNRIISKWIS